ncbi:MAG: ATP synthase F1 subunit delta [Sedimentisphaerales bacterium]|nr:ATP synthase F1 subunit delta [Sedimentisphaerales bacterium]
MASEEYQTIAWEYAKAIYELSQGQNLTETVRAELEGLAQLTGEIDEFGIFLENPSIHRDDKAAGLENMFQGKVCDLVMNFLKVLANRERLNLLNRISQNFSNMDDARQGRVKGRLTTAIALDGREYSRLTEQIGRTMHKKVTLMADVDPAIIAGMILTIEGKVMDFSVRGALQQFSRQLKQSAGEKIRTDNQLLMD